MIVFMSGTAWAAHMCLAQAMKCADASVVIPFEFIRLPITAIAAFFLMSPWCLALAGAGHFLWHLATSEKRRAEIGSKSSVRPIKDMACLHIPFHVAQD